MGESMEHKTNWGDFLASCEDGDEERSMKGSEWADVRSPHDDLGNESTALPAGILPYKTPENSLEARDLCEELAIAMPLTAEDLQVRDVFSGESNAPSHYTPSHIAKVLSAEDVQVSHMMPAYCWLGQPQLFGESMAPSLYISSHMAVVLGAKDPQALHVMPVCDQLGQAQVLRGDIMAPSPDTSSYALRKTPDDTFEVSETLITDAMNCALAIDASDVTRMLQRHGNQFQAKGSQAEAWIQQPPHAMWTYEKGQLVIKQFGERTKPDEDKYYTAVLTFQACIEQSKKQASDPSTDSGESAELGPPRAADAGWERQHEKRKGIVLQIKTQELYGYAVMSGRRARGELGEDAPVTPDAYNRRIGKRLWDKKVRLWKGELWKCG